MSIMARVHLGGSQAADGGVRSLFHPMGIDGIYARSALYERVVEGVSALISGYRVPDTEVLRFPPVMSRHQLEKSGYMQSFPHLMGCVSCLNGDEAEISNHVQLFEVGGEWTSGLSLADVVLTPAACYPLIRLWLAVGTCPPEGCFSTLLAIVFGGSRQRIWLDFNRSGCANTSVSVPPNR